MDDVTTPAPSDTCAHTRRPSRPGTGRRRRAHGPRLAALAVATAALGACPGPARAQTEAAPAAPAPAATTPAAPAPAAAEPVADVVQEGIVVTAPRYVPSRTSAGSKTDTPLIETPQSITVINRDQIDLLNDQDLGEAVRYTAGVDGELFGDDERYDWLTIRGFTPVEYIDGLQAPVGAVSNSGVDLFGFDSVEILKGPSSALYGLAPPGGLVNLTSRRPQDTFGGEIQLLGGSFDDKQVNADVTGPIGDRVDFRLTGVYRDRDTQTDDAYDRRYYIAPALTVKLTGQDTLTFLSYFQRDKLMNDGGGFLPAYGTLLPNPNGALPVGENLGVRGYNDFVREQWGVGYDYKHAFSDAVTFEQNLKYFGNNNHTLQIYGGGLFGTASGDYSTETRYNYPSAEKIRALEVDSRITAKFSTGPVRNTFLAGVDYRNYHDQFRYGFASGPSVDLYDAPDYVAGVVTPALSILYTDVQQDQAGVYFEDQARIAGFVFTGGGRGDFVDTYSGTAAASAQHVEDRAFTYHGGVNYVFANGLAPYVGYATSFQPLSGANPDGSPFKPTTGDQVEGGIKFEPRFVPRSIKSLSTLAIFDLHQNDTLAPNLAETPVLEEQIGKVHVAGVEIENVSRIREALSVNFAYSYLYSKGPPAVRAGGPATPAAEIGTYNSDPPLSMTPRNKASLLVDYTLQAGPLRGLGLGAGVRYLGATFGDTAGEWRDPSETLWDGLIHYNLDKWRLQVDATNLFDRKYVVQCSSFTACYYAQRRNVIATLTRAF